MKEILEQCKTEQKKYGRWTKKQHNLFVKGYKTHGRKWKLIQKTIKSRTLAQIRSHAQKYFIRQSNYSFSSESESFDDFYERSLSLSMNKIKIELENNKKESEPQLIGNLVKKEDSRENVLFFPSNQSSQNLLIKQESINQNTIFIDYNTWNLHQYYQKYLEINLLSYCTYFHKNMEMHYQSVLNEKCLQFINLTNISRQKKSNKNDNDDCFNQIGE